MIPLQKIIFGPPGTGKSYSIDQIAKEYQIQDENKIKTVFHPDYIYGDFIGKLMPLSDENGKPSYKYYPGYFLRALGKAYENILTNPSEPEHVFLVIDEINRGNAAAIFGSVFQLLDRNEIGWSEYHIMMSDIEIDTLIKLSGYKFNESKKNSKNIYLDAYHSSNNHKEFVSEIDPDKKNDAIKKHIQECVAASPLYKPLDELIISKNIKLPPNLSLIATMNTSDESIYYMDSAFKRRWEWEPLPVNDPNTKKTLDQVKIESTPFEWTAFVDKLNAFILSQSQAIRRIEDKQVGYYFIKPVTENQQKYIKKDAIKNKLLFFLWDNVFTRDKSILAQKIGGKELKTFYHFAEAVDDFIKNIMNF